MSENKFIQHLKGVATAGSVLEVKNQGTHTSFANMPDGTSNPNTVFSDHRGNATAVLNGTDNWQLDGSSLTLATNVYGDGRDLTSTYNASGAGLWVNATYNFDSAKIFNGNTKWVLKLCGSNLLATNVTVEFTLLVKINNDTVITKDFMTTEQAGNFCKEFVIDFAEGEPDVVHVESGDTLSVQLLCADSTASATIYNGMTVLTALQRRVAGDTVSSDTYTFDEVATELDNKVSKTGDTMSGPLTFTNTAGAGGIFGYTNGVVFFYMNGDTLTQLAALNTVGFAPYIDNTMILGGADLRWKELHASKAYISAINNGYDIAVPVTNSADTLALKSEVDGKVSKSGDTMTGELLMLYGSRISFRNSTASTKHYIRADGQRTIMFGSGWNASIQMYWEVPTGDLYSSLSTSALGKSTKPWGNVYTAKINNGGDLAVPAVSGTLATKADVDLAANSGRMITDQGVWYAKMDALGTIPSSAEVEGRNYADFTQVDGNNDPIIVIYTYTSGAWVQTETITPPSAYDGYVPITSKIWDIPEQTGQQGGRILWNHTSKDFTPYPMIVSFDGANITNGAFQGSADLSGASTVTMPVAPSSTQIVNKDYVDTAIAAIPSGAFDLFDIKWRDSTTSNTSWALSDGNWKTNATAYQHLVDDYDNISSYLHSMGTVSGVNYYSDPSRNVPGATYEYAFSSFDETIVTTVYSNTSAPEGGTDHFYNGSGSGATDLGVLDGSGQASTSLKSTIAYEKIGNTTVVYVTAADGHKICLPDQETNVDAIYAATGVAWYYILDTANQQFMLPRTQFGFTGVRNNVGDYVEAGLPNITGNNAMGYSNAGTPSGAFKKGADTSTIGAGGGQIWRINFDASASNAIYGASTTVQPPATEMYLYFYVGV